MMIMIVKLTQLWSIFPSNVLVMVCTPMLNLTSQATSDVMEKRYGDMIVLQVSSLTFALVYVIGLSL